MGAYFRSYTKGKVVEKTLIRKRNGSLYPAIDNFNAKINLIQKYLGNFVVDTNIGYNEKSIRIEQPFIEGVDIFEFLKKQKPKRFNVFIKKLNILYLKTGILPDLLNKGNILVTKNKEMKIVDVWPLFFKKRVKDGDINKESYEENLQRFNFLRNYCDRSPSN